ncbi:MAG TPA: hypothetical protein VMW45_03325 [Dehalococcoidia bacterium]|nr:hypothetical protein [Dehalococcoidia bacterium]
MNYLPFKVWFIVALTLVLGAVIVRLAWEVIVAAPSLVVIILVMFTTLSIYALLLYLIIKPSLKKLKSLLVRIWVSVIVTAAIISAIVHYIRFLPLPEATLPLSVIIASLLLAASISIYLLVLWALWFKGIKKRD